MTNEFTAAREGWKARVADHVEALARIHRRYEVVGIAEAAVTSQVVAQLRLNELVAADIAGYEESAIRRIFRGDRNPHAWAFVHSDLTRLFSANSQLITDYFQAWGSAVADLHAYAGAQQLKLPENWEESQSATAAGLREAAEEGINKVHATLVDIALLDPLHGNDANERARVEASLTEVLSYCRTTLQLQRSLSEWLEQLSIWDPVEGLFEEVKSIEDLLRQALGDKIVDQAHATHLTADQLREAFGKAGQSDAE